MELCLAWIQTKPHTHTHEVGIVTRNSFVANNNNQILKLKIILWSDRNDQTTQQQCDRIGSWTKQKKVDKQNEAIIRRMACRDTWWQVWNCIINDRQKQTHTHNNNINTIDWQCNWMKVLERWESAKWKSNRRWQTVYRSVSVSRGT